MIFKNIIAKFKPDKKGLEKVLGPLEAEVLHIVWDLEKASVRDVFERLSRQRDIAYTTVMTIMARLAQKKLLKKEKAGLAYLYRPACSCEEFTKSMVGEVLNGLMEDYAELTFSHFLEKIGKEDESKIHMLEQMLLKRAEKGK